MSANLYDLLDVDETATEAEVRAAWKAAIADLDPTERRFRAYNDAAEVLLDPERRAAYDAELADQRAETEPDEPTEPEDASEPEPAVAVPAKEAEQPAHPAGKAERRGPSVAVLAVLGVVAVLCIALAVWIATLPGARGDISAKERSERNVAVERAALSAEAAAEQMVTPVLSYNHKTMAADLDRMRDHMTDALAGKQAKGWPDFTKEAESQEIVVEAKATGSALTRVDPSGKRATVVVFVDQYVTKKDADPFTLQMWATFSLVRAAGSESRWLLDDLCTDERCG